MSEEGLSKDQVEHFFGPPSHLRDDVLLNSYSTPQWRDFVGRYPELFAETRVSRPELTRSRGGYLVEVAKRISARIQYRSERVDRWTVVESPGHGDCDDFAMTQRAELIRSGWPRSAVHPVPLIFPASCFAWVICGSPIRHLTAGVCLKQTDLILDQDGVVRTPLRYVRQAGGLSEHGIKAL